MLNVDIATDFPLQGSMLDEWNELLSASEFATPFQTNAWMTAWWNHFGKGLKPQLFLLREGNDLVGGFATYVSNGPWRTLRAIGTGQSDYLHALARKGYVARVRDAFWESVHLVGGIDLVDVHQWREDCGPGPEESDTLHQATCLSIDLPSSFEQYLGTISKSLRVDCRRIEKSPFNERGARIVPSSVVGLEKSLDALFDLHAKRWRGRGLPGAFALRSLRLFHFEASNRLEQDGQLRIAVMEVDGQPAGVIYAMQVAGTRFFYQCGFDPAHKSLSPGTLLVSESIRESIGQGCRSFDLMRGDEPYKRRWCPQHSRGNLRYILPLSAGRGGVGRQFNNAAAKIEAKVRNRLEGRGLLK